MPDAGQHVLQRLSTAAVKMHVIERDHRHTCAIRNRRKLAQAYLVVPAEMVVRAQIQPPLPLPPQINQPHHEIRLDRWRWQGDQDHAFGVGAQVFEINETIALGRATAAQRQQSAQAAIGCPVGGVGQKRSTGSCILWLNQRLCCGALCS